jgi:uncharacterized protein YgfB (UPF0149 family)
MNTLKILNEIKRLQGHEDWRNVFEDIHNWGYTTDFTYNPVTDVMQTTVDQYLKEYVSDVFDVQLSLTEEKPTIEDLRYAIDEAIEAWQLANGMSKNDIDEQDYSQVDEALNDILELE